MQTQNSVKCHYRVAIQYTDSVTEKFTESSANLSAVPRVGEFILLNESQFLVEQVWYRNEEVILKCTQTKVSKDAPKPRKIFSEKVIFGRG